MTSNTALDRSPALHRHGGLILQSFSANSPLRRSTGVEQIVETGDMRTARLHVERSDAVGDCEFVSLEPGLFLVVLDLSLPNGLRTPVIGEDLIEFHYRVSGRISLSGHWGDVVMDSPSLLLWHQPDGHDDVWEELDSNPAGRELSVTLFLTRAWLQRLFHQNLKELPSQLAQILHDRSRSPTYRIMPSRPEVATTLQAILHDTDMGPIRLLNMRARGYELLAASLKAIAADPAKSSRYFSLRDVGRIDEAKAILLTEFAAPPAMSKLARRVGLNLNMLSSGLKLRHGMTGQEIVRNARLDEAHSLLLGSELQVSQIADAVGYAHHSTFTAAFVERFGVAPKAIMQARRASRCDLVTAPTKTAQLTIARTQTNN